MYPIPYTNMPTLRALYKSLTEDKWRKSNPFSDEISKVHEIVFDPFSTPAYREEAYLLWMQGHQPCLFGKIAAASHRIHFCVLDESDILGSEADVAKKIEHERIEWKRRSLRPHASFSHPAHGFVLLASSPRLAKAAPDNNLRRFAERLLSLWKVLEHVEPQGKIYSEWLYLQNPKNRKYVRFQFSVDFFMAQGDGRWWQDHRIPGGIAFTANSVGHMRRYREWYENYKKQKEWAIEVAMRTIHAAQPTDSGKATWLKPLIDGKPIVSDVRCPFSDPSKIRPELVGMDWSRYGGHLHTDQAVRDEFFWDEPAKHPDVTKQEYIQDFAYLIDKRQIDHNLFVEGQNVAEREVFDEIGDPSNYVRISVKPSKRRLSARVPEAERKAGEVKKKLQSLRSWRFNEEYS
jgi:hypothetical protein